MTDYAASVQAVGIRLTKLDAAGAPVVGAKKAYTTKALIRFSWTPEYTDGEEIEVPAADGTTCVYYKAPDVLKQITWELEICKPSPEIYEFLGGGTLITGAVGTAKTVTNKALTSNVATLTTSTAHGLNVGDLVVVSGVDATFDGTYEVTVVGSTTTFSYAKVAADVASTAATGTATLGGNIGWAAPDTGIDAVPNGVAIEVWSRAIVDGKPAAVNPYWRHIAPYAKPRLEGDRELSNGNLAAVFSGTGVGNSGFGDGPVGDWALESSQAIQFARDTANPVTGDAYVTVIA